MAFSPCANASQRVVLLSFIDYLLLSSASPVQESEYVSDDTDFMQAREDEELARAIAASLGDDSAPAQPASSSAPAQQSAVSSDRPRPVALGEVEAGDVVSSAAPAYSSQQGGHKGNTRLRVNL